jgi:hypothetical protein
MKRILRAGVGFFLPFLWTIAPRNLHAQDKPQPKTKVAAIEVLPIVSDEIKLPAEFRVSLYENLIDQLQAGGAFQHVYREGDRNAQDAGDLVIIHSTVQGFKKGSERARQVTTVAGATSIKIHCVFTDKNGKSLLEQDIEGKVRFFGGNLRATYDFAKKVAKVARDNFSLNAH